MTEIPNLTRRRIQAEIVKPIYDELVAEIGAVAARALLARAVSRSVEAEAARAAAAQPHEGAGMDAFAANFRRTYGKDKPEAGLDVEVTRADETNLDFAVTRCRFVEMYRELGLGDVADVLSCNRDGQFATAFDANIALDRPQTIAGGAPICLFRYRYVRSDDGETR